MYIFVICTYLAKRLGKICRNWWKYVVQALHFGLNPAVTQFTQGWKNYEFLSPAYWANQSNIDESTCSFFPPIRDEMTKCIPIIGKVIHNANEMSVIEIGALVSIFPVLLANKYVSRK